MTSSTAITNLKVPTPINNAFLKRTLSNSGSSYYGHEKPSLHVLSRKQKKGNISTRGLCITILHYMETGLMFKSLEYLLHAVSKARSIVDGQWIQFMSQAFSYCSFPTCFQIANGSEDCKKTEQILLLAYPFKHGNCRNFQMIIIIRGDKGDMEWPMQMESVPWASWSIPLGVFFFHIPFEKWLLPTHGGFFLELQEKTLTHLFTIFLAWHLHFLQ